MEINISTSINPDRWQRKIGEYLQGGHHGRIFQNELDTTAPQNVGHAIMSTALLNVKSLGRRLSQDAGFPIACTINDIVLKSEMSYYWSEGQRDDGIQAVHFKVAEENKENAIEYLSNLMTGTYTKVQILLCPLMKFQIRRCKPFR